MYLPMVQRINLQGWELALTVIFEFLPFETAVILPKMKLTEHGMQLIRHYHHTKFDTDHVYGIKLFFNVWQADGLPATIA